MLHGYCFKQLGRLLLLGGLASIVCGCSDESVFNRPYPLEQTKENIYYTAFGERPKHLDPAISYSSNEWIITTQIYEPLLQYHYLKRPYTLEPLVAAAMPQVKAFDIGGNSVDVLSPNVVKTEYKISVKPDIYFAPHPAFYYINQSQSQSQSQIQRQNPNSNTVVSTNTFDEINTLSDFKESATRELVAEDFVYQIKRLADPKLNSPVYGHMSEYIIGLKELREKLEAFLKENPNAVYDLRDFELSGVKALSKYELSITLKGYYPQFLYWLAMPFFSPMPYEADKFYANPNLIEKNITLDWYPIGTGPYQLVENNPSLDMILTKNPKFHLETFPNVKEEGSGEGLVKENLVEDKEGPNNFAMSKLAGLPLPFLDKIIFSLEKENIPRWNKFIQGYYDGSGISSDNFDQALQMQGNGLILSDELKAQGIRLEKAISPTVHYWAVNMLDTTVGGYTPEAQKLRKAISLAFDMEEYITIFLNGRGVVAHSPLAPEIFGYQSGTGSFGLPDVSSSSSSSSSNLVSSTPSVPSSLEQAKKLLAEAGYPGGIDPKTNQPLILNLDTKIEGGPDAKEEFNWLRKQFSKLGINLIIRATQYNRFQDKMSHGNAQIFSWGWSADYPDPENFLFLLYGPNGKVKFGGENAANYQNEEFDKLFLTMKQLSNGADRQSLINQMLALLDKDTPWLAGFHPESFSLIHSWVGPTKANAMTHNTLKYLTVDPKKRFELQNAWNKPILWPIIGFILLFIILVLPAYLQYRKKIKQKQKLRPEKTLVTPSQLLTTTDTTMVVTENSVSDSKSKPNPSSDVEDKK